MIQQKKFDSDICVCVYLKKGIPFSHGIRIASCTFIICGTIVGDTLRHLHLDLLISTAIIITIILITYGGLLKTDFAANTIISIKNCVFK